MRHEVGPQNVQFQSGTGSAYGYLALPDGGESGRGVIVIQEWWGLTDHVRAVCERFASEGFVALAPDLYGGRVAHDRDEARKMMAELPVEQAVVDLAGAVDFLLDHDRVVGSSVGAVGFCMGGGFVLVLAARERGRIGAAVPYYAVGAYETADLSGTTAPVLGHFASEDQSAPPEQARALESALEESGSPLVDIRIYEGAGHGFFNDEGVRYDRELAESSWNDTVRFLREHLAESR